MHWYLLVERMWSPELAVAAQRSVDTVRGAEAKAKVVKERGDAQALIDTLFPPDEEADG